MLKLAHDLLGTNHPLHNTFLAWLGLPKGTKTPINSYTPTAIKFLKRYPQYATAKRA
jgi:hypothetical protein